MISRKAILIAVAFSALVVRGAAAQATRPIEMSAAYVYVRDPSIDLTFPAGWSVGVAKPMNGWLSLAGAYDDSRATTETIVGDLRSSIRTAMAGGKASAKLGRAIEFGQLLFGVAHESGSGFGTTVSSMHASTQIGGGVDYPLSRRIAARVEFDYRVFGLRRAGGAELARQVRGLAGIVISRF